MRNHSLTALCILLLASAAAADHTTAKKPLSPLHQAQYSETHNGKTKKITIDYSSPSMRGRKVMGALVPYGKVWRTGANAATTLTTNADLMIGSLHVPAGKYTLYTIPGEKEWTLIVNRQTGQWGTDYHPAKDLGRVKMTVAPRLKEPVEQFTIEVGKTLSMSWENTKVWVPVIVH